MRWLFEDKEKKCHLHKDCGTKNAHRLDDECHTSTVRAVYAAMKECSVNFDLIEVIISSLDVKRILTRSLFPATVAGACGAPPAVVVQNGWVAVHVRLLSYRS